MNYLIKFFIVIFTFISSIVIANENRIIFEINNKIFTQIDFKNRIEYLNTLNSSKLSAELNLELINDFFSTVVFYEYSHENNIHKNILEKESTNLLEQIKFSNKGKINEKNILKNARYDFARKVILENILNNYQEYIFSNPEDINTIYRFQINYITFRINDPYDDKKFKEILNSQDYTRLISFLNSENIKYHSEVIDVKDLNKTSSKIKKLINFKNKFLHEKNKDFYRIINLKKQIDVSNGVYYRLVNFETNELLNENQQNCNYISSLNNLKSIKEYELNKLNENIKSNLISINDFIVFQNDNLLNYVFLCEIKVNEDFLKEININKKINFLAKEIELDFINKYSKLFNAKKYYE